MDQDLRNLQRYQPNTLAYLWRKRRDGHALTDFEKIRLIHWLPDAEVKELFWKFRFLQLNSRSNVYESTNFYIAEIGYAWEIALGEIILRGINPIQLHEAAEFSWSFHYRFFLQTEYGNYVWNDPDYEGDNTITPFYGGLRDFCKWANIPFTRDKGHHIIGDYILHTQSTETVPTTTQEKLDIKIVDTPIKVPGACHPKAHLSKLVLKELK
jgi:hypothetical protein